jgi:hypothetical protein
MGLDTEMQLQFKTACVKTATRCAMSLLEGRQSSHEPLTRDGVRLWVAERFPKLNQRDHEQLIATINANI